MKLHVIQLNFLVIGFLLIVSSCTFKPSAEEQKQALVETVMQVHDSAMSQMETTYQLRTNFKKLQKQVPKQVHISGGVEDMQHLITQLEQAEEAMMAWMHQYQTPENLPVQQAIVYLQQQLVKIKQVKNNIDQTLIMAQKTLQKYDKT